MTVDGHGKEDRIQPPASGVTLRLYRQGLGDCFLLAFPRADAEPFNLLIDCGVILGTPESKRVMEAVVRDIAAATGGRIDLLVITHEHWDHVSGFVQAEDVWRTAGIQIGSVWMAWTEDMSIPLALRLKQDFQNDLDALRLALDRVGQDVRQSTALSGLLGMFGDPVAFMAAAKAKRRFSEATHDALNNARELAGNRVLYRKPGESLTLQNVPGVRIHILGPPQHERALRNINPSRRSPQTYTQGSEASSRRRRRRGELSEKSAFTLALRFGAAPGTTAAPLTDREEELSQRCHPFEWRLRIPKHEIAQMDFFRRHYGFSEPAPETLASAQQTLPEPAATSLPAPGPAWRRINNDFAAVAMAPRREPSRGDERTHRVGKRKAAAARKRHRKISTSTVSGSGAEPAPKSQRMPLPGPPPETMYPFDRHLRIGLDEAARMPFFWEHYGFDGAPPPETPAPTSTPVKTDPEAMGPEWRRIDNDWLSLADELALQMDSYTNNTSLAMAIELVGTGKVLLFPADAQVGNWLSWDAIQALTAADGRPVTAADLLRRTVFYKVGHHGSHNATMREVGLERMISPELVAFVPVDERVAHDVRNWRDMPYGPLLAQLYERTKGRVIRLDQGVVTDQKPDFLPEDVWQRLVTTARAFRHEELRTGGQIPGPDGGQQPLYFEFVIADELPQASSVAARS